jgi:c-di-GMP-binding flagellar brake protein YcgR
VAIEGAPRRCIVRDLSFGGAKILVTGMAEPRKEKKVLLKLNRCEMKDDTVLDGSIVRVEGVEGRDDVVALSIQFTTEPPISYKQKINGYFSAPDGAD